MTRAPLALLGAMIALLGGCDPPEPPGRAPVATAESVPLGPPPPGPLLGAPLQAVSAPPVPAPQATGLPGALPAMATAAALASATAAPASTGAPRTVPFLQQVGAGCVPYAAAAVAQFHGADVDPLGLLRAVPVTRFGVAYSDVAAELTRRGIQAEVVHPAVPELRRMLAAGFPIVVGQTFSAVSDHAVVAIRYDAARAIYSVMDPSQPALRELAASGFEAAYEGTGRQALWIRPAARR